MNIFVLHKDPFVAAKQHCDKHVVKMIVESAQMLSTAHRILDGVERICISNGRRYRRWFLSDSRERVMYKSVHTNHPCTLWTRESSKNYTWHYNLFVALCEEYTHRYGKVHATESKLVEVLSFLPDNLPCGDMTNFRLAMNSSPECISPDPIQSYRNFYKTKKKRFKMVWTKRQTPEWFIKEQV
jgi:hypothetical protein|tara:strand:+ start:664 stop:1215 length:552 start_codon:yes stop_codon:yes gene_type:complete